MLAESASVQQPKGNKKMNFKLGVCQFEPRLLDKKYNIEKMIQLVDGLNADLIVFPELATSGYVFSSRDEARSIADNFEISETTQIFVELSKKNDTAFIIGFPESDGDKLYNSSMLINPDGTKHLYRKIHLFNEERLWFDPGDIGFVVAPTKHNVKVGQMICFDWIFPESARTLMLRGAQIIAHPANLVLPWCQQAMITRSLENRVFTATANRTGTEVNGDKSFYFTGMSQILSPLGEILHRMETTEESVKIVEIDIDKTTELKNVTPHNHVITDRRTEFYY
jgi:predicted amidohydrolase